MTGIVDVGGGLRGIYGAGIFDYCMEQGSILITVSAYQQEVRMSAPILQVRKGEIISFIQIIHSAKNT